MSPRTSLVPPSNHNKLKNTKKRIDGESGFASLIKPRISSALDRVDTESQISQVSYVSRGGVSNAGADLSRKMNIQNKRHSTGNLHFVNNKLTDNKYMKKNEE